MGTGPKNSQRGTCKGNHKKEAAARSDDVECIKVAAAAQGINGNVDSSKSLQYTMKVNLSDPNPSRFDVETCEGAMACSTQKTCGEEGFVFPAFGLEKPIEVNPIVPTQVTTTETRRTPKVTFECDPKKKYHLVVQDGLHGPPQDQFGMVHWAKFNIPCNGGQGSTESSGVDMEQGIVGRHYLPPSFPWHDGIFHFVIFETKIEFNAEQLGQFNTYMTDNNIFSGAGTGDRPKPADVVTINKIMTKSPLKDHFQNLVARSWLGVTTSPWSAMNFASMGPAGQVPNFYEYMCGCSTPESREPVTWKNCTLFPLDWNDGRTPWPQGWGGRRVTMAARLGFEA